MSSTNSLFLDVNKPGTFKLHPVVVFSILDHYKRRGEEQKRVVGALLGEKVGEEIIIRNSFPIPHSETEDTVTLDMEYYNTMMNLHTQVNPKEVVVGWYSTGGDIPYTSSLVQGLFKKLVPMPVLLTVDTNLSNFRLNIKAYVSKDVSIGDKHILSRFEEVDLTYFSYDAEKIGVDALINGNPDDDVRLDAPATILSDFDNLEVSLSNLLHSIETVSKYVERVCAGEIKGDEEVGRAIAHALAALPVMDQESFEKMFNSNIQDLLMIVYLSNLTRTQIALSDRIQGLISQ